jgi:hypothetical protein
MHSSSPGSVKTVLGLIAGSLLAGLLSSFAAFAQSDAPSTPPAQASAKQPTDAERESWRRQILKTPRPKSGCFTAAYPDTAWREVPCGTPPHTLYPPKEGGLALTETVGGSGSDFSAEVTSRSISAAEGSFDSGTTVTGECNAQCPKGACPATCANNDPTSDYSLQLNTSYFTTIACADSPNKNASPPHKCQGWQQFVYHSGGSGLIQYWLLHYGPSGTSCPKPISANCQNGVQTDGWCPFTFSATGDVFCVINAKQSATPPSEPITSLDKLKVTGQVAGVAGEANDEIIVTANGQPWTASGNNYFTDLGSQWQEAEFNVFGDGNGSRAIIQSGSTIHVRTAITDGPTSAPSAQAQSWTGESNSLNLIPPACPIGSVDGKPPAIVFTESNVSGATSICSCPAGQVWIPNDGACGPPAATCQMTGCVGSSHWQYSMTCTGMDVGIIYSGGCVDPGGEPASCNVGSDGSSTVSASWIGAPGPPTWYTPSGQGSPTVCTQGFGQLNCNTYTFSNLPVCASTGTPVTPMCGVGEKYCTKFSPPMCVPEKLCTVQSGQPPPR